MSGKAEFMYEINMGLLGIHKSTQFDNALNIIHRETGAKRLHYHSKSHFPQWEMLNGKKVIKVWQSRTHGEHEPVLATISRIPMLE
jgi:hypothetical protein